MKPAAWYSAAVTAALLPLIYWTTWRVLTGPFSAEVQSVVVGAVVGSGLGAVTLDVGGLKTIPSATAAWVDVEFTGSAWVLTGYGTL